VNPKLLALFGIFLLAAVSSPGQSLSVTSLTGPVTSSEINSFIAYMQSQSPPPTPWGALSGTGHNAWADGTGGRDLEAMGEMFIISSNMTILNTMISWADDCASQRNDLMAATNGGQRVMWTGLIDKVWCPNWPTDTTDDQSQYCGCETEDVIGHMAFCAKLILQSPGIWNLTVPDGDPYGYGATYLQRATSYLAKSDDANNEYFLKWFIQPGASLIVAPTNAAWVALNENVNAINRQMMFTSGFQRLAEAHELLGDNPALAAQYNAIVQATVNLCLSGMVNFDTYTTNGQRVYDWGYYPTSDAPEATEIHAEYDMIGVWRAFNNPSYGVTLPPLVPFANTLADVIYLGTNTFAGNVAGSGGTQSPIYSGWLWTADWNPQVYNIVAGAAYAHGWYTGSPDIDAAILFMKNRRYLEFSATPTPSSQLVQAGGAAVFTLAVAPMGGFSNTVSLAVNGLPPNTTANFSATAVNCGVMSLSQSNVTLSIQTSAATPIGAYTLSIVASSDAVAHTNTATQVIGTYSISANPGLQAVLPGATASYTVSVSTNTGFSGATSFGLTGLPSNCSAQFNPASLVGAGSVALNVVVSNNAPAGNYTLTISGTNGLYVAQTMAALQIVSGGTAVWNGGSVTDNNWSDSANWNGSGIGANYALNFGGNSRLENINDTTAGTAYSNIVFNASAGVFVLNGNAIALIGNLTNDSPNPQTVQLGLNFGANLTFDGASNNLDIFGGLTNTAGAGVTTLSLDGSGQLSDLWISASQPGGTNMLVLNDSAADWTVVHNIKSSAASVPWVFEVNAGIFNFGTASSAPVVNSVTTHNQPKDFEIANNPSTTATFNMVNGTLTIDGPLDTCTALNSTGNVSQNGGTMNVNGAPYYFQGANGANTGESSSVNISGGTMNMGTSAAPSGPFYVASRGNGSLTVSGSGALNCGTLDVSRNASGNTFGSIGQVNLNGGTLTASRVGAATANQQAGPASDGITPSATFNFNGGTLRAAAGSATFYQGSTASPAIPITSIIQAGGAFIDSSNFSISILEPLQSGATPDGGLTKLGTGTLTLEESNSYNGPTLVSAGTLALSGSGSIGDSALISVTSSGLLDASASAGGGLTLTAGQELTGAGVVKGNVTVSAGGIIAPGGSLNALAFSNNLTMNPGSATLVEVSHSPMTNDSAQVAGALVYGGALIVTNVGATPLAAGDSFKLFSAASYSGAFAAISPPAPGPNLAWDTNDLSNGVLNVISQIIVPTVPPVITSFSFAGRNVVISGTAAQAGATYYLLMSTNLLLPTRQWTAVATNVAAQSNNFAFIATNAVSPTDPQQFFILSGTNN
jgi:autotransporter-associated beta strand protein